MPGIGACRGAARPGRPAPSPARRRRAATARAASRRYSRRSVATWSLRLRPARSLPPSAPSRSSRPRSSAVCTSSSSTRRAGTRRRAPRRRGRPGRRASRPSSSSVEQPGAVQHPGVRPRGRRGRTAPAASRSARSTDSAASAVAGPPANRPPHSRVGRRWSLTLDVLVVATTSLDAHASIPRLRARVTAGPVRRRGAAAHLAGQAPQLDEALGQRLVERVAGVVGRQARSRTATASLRRPVTTARPPCRVIRTSPVTCSLASSTNRPAPASAARTTGRRRPARPSAARRPA